MKIYVFRSRNDAKVVGYTEFADVGNLPDEFAPWIPQGAANIELAAASLASDQSSV